MHAYSLDLRQRVLAHSDRGMSTSDPPPPSHRPVERRTPHRTGCHLRSSDDLTDERNAPALGTLTRPRPPSARRWVRPDPQ